MVVTSSQYKKQFTVREIIDIRLYTRDAEQIQIIYTALPTVRRLRDKL